MIKKICFIIALLSIVSCSTQLPENEIPIDQLNIPEGFQIDLYAYPVPNARQMDLGPKGVVFVGSRSEGKVYAVIDNDQNFRADEIVVIDSGLNNPNGVAFYEGDLYVSEIDKILKYENIMETLNEGPKPIVVYNKFPKDKHHGWKYIKIGPDGMLYVPVGAPCNVCLEDDPYATLTRMNLDGSGFEIYAQGIRNTVGFDFHPDTGELWFTDNGRDMMGNDIPPDELNYAPLQGMHFGYPFCHGTQINDPDYKDINCKEFRDPVQELGPHVAALGMEFYDGEQFPEFFKNHVFIAEHGSWNRDTKIGYRVTHVTLEDDSAVKYEVFASGWLQGEDSWGRPVDVELMQDGSMLVSDDKLGAIYRISYPR